MPLDEGSIRDQMEDWIADRIVEMSIVENEGFVEGMTDFLYISINVELGEKGERTFSPLTLL